MRFDSRPTEPDDSSGIPEECPVCDGVNHDDETGELLRPSACCSEPCESKAEHGLYAVVDMEHGRYIGSGENGIYYAVGQGPKGWYLSTMVDCNSGGFCNGVIFDDGPYEKEADAWLAGRDSGVEWCVENKVDWAELPWEDDKLQFAQLLYHLHYLGIDQETLDQAAESMDLDPDLLKELFDRAIKVFDDAKAKAEDEVFSQDA